jgi:acetyltransferase-like isoleucine patch superfamily enzyme
MFAKIQMMVRLKVMERNVEGFKAHLLARIDKSSTVGVYCRLYSRSLLANAIIGDFTYLSPKALVTNCDVGRFCCIGPEAIVGGLGRHPTNWISSHPVFYSILGQVSVCYSDKNYFDELPRTKVGSDVWIGARAIVLDGVTVGDGAIIAAGAIVTKDVAPYAIVGGVPAKLIRYRFDKQVVEELIRLKWWTLPINVLKENAYLFRTDTKKAVSLLKQIG